MTVTTGNTILWQCDPPLSNPPAAIDYYKNGAYISLSIPIQTPSLIIPNVNVSHTGKYTCIANNLIQQSSQKNDFYLSLKIVNSGPNQAPVFIKPLKTSYTVNAGNN